MEAQIDMMTHEAVHSGVHLVLEVTTLALAKLDGMVDQTLVRRLVRSCENQRWVGRGVLGLVDVDCCKALVSPLCASRFG